MKRSKGGLLSPEKKPEEEKPAKGLFQPEEGLFQQPKESKSKEGGSLSYLTKPADGAEKAEKSSLFGGKQEEG